MRNFFVFQGGQKGGDFYIYCERSLSAEIISEIFAEGGVIYPLVFFFIVGELFWETPKIFARGTHDYPLIFSIYYKKEIFKKFFARKGQYLPPAFLHVCRGRFFSFHIP